MPVSCLCCKMLFAGNESLRLVFLLWQALVDGQILTCVRKISLRKHYLSNNSCKKPSETEEEKNQKEPEVKYRCPGHPTCTFFGPLRLILIHMYKHPEANVKFRQGIHERSSLPDCSCSTPDQISYRGSYIPDKIEKIKIASGQM